MELTEKTISVLKNYASINSNIVISEGNELKTVTEAKNVCALAKVDVEFPREIGIYDLNEFLATLNLLDTPTIRFEESYASISDGSGRAKIKYFYSDPENLTSPPTKFDATGNKLKPVNMPQTDVQFTLDEATLSKIKRAASVLGHSEVSVSVDNNVVVLTVIDNSNRTSNAFSIVVDGEFETSDFNFVFNISNLKMIDGDYVVSISRKLISHFVNKESGFEYWVALEKSSTYGA